jgi:isoleucyl-tRNA synthetase
MTQQAAQQYTPVAKVPDRVAIERAVLARWNATRVFDRLREQTGDGEPYSLLDGPITANNPMGVHHAWGRTLKDVIQRYQAMNGRQLRWQNGFDCQGLWVEVEVEKSLGFNSRREIEAFGLDRFARACRDRVATYAGRITEQSARLGMWMDWDRSYYTMTDTNIGYIWGFLAECHRRGWLQQGRRLMPWCHRCGTSLSQHELADSYAELTHPSVFLRLPLEEGDGRAKEAGGAAEKGGGAAAEGGGAAAEAYGWLSGRHVSGVDAEILGRLAEGGLLLHAGTLQHRYPLCWRCSTPLVHRVVDEWFISCDQVRQPMREAAATVSWHPAHLARRMDDWLANMGDWCISRKRYWGLPLPFYFCPDGHLTVIGSPGELRARAVAGAGQLPELHRPWIDAVTVACRTCAAPAARVPEVGDCWLDAGIVAFSTLGWRNDLARQGGYADGAGEGLTTADLPDHAYWQRWFPAEVVCEMHEQTRLWFYSLLFMAVVLDGRAPYRRVLAYARVNAADGQEMHKSKGNAVWFDDAVAEVGADTMRWPYASQPPGRDLRFGYGPARQAARRFLTLWNSYAFFVTYANIDGFRPAGDLRDRGPEPGGLAPVDRWLLARAQQLIRGCRGGLDRLDLPAVTAALDRFADDLSNWYLRSSRERFWAGAGTPGKAAAYQTLWYALVTAVRCMAPVMPFVADEMWRNLVSGVLPDAPDSVHLGGYPAVAGALDDAAALAAMDDARQVTELGRTARAAAGIRRRQPLRVMLAVCPDGGRRGRLAYFADLVARECNVKELRILGQRAELPAAQAAAAGGWEVALDTTVTPELELEGRARDLVRRIQRLRKDRDLAVTARIDVVFPEDEAPVVAALGSWIGQQTLARSLSPGGELDLAVADADPAS